MIPTDDKARGRLWYLRPGLKPWWIGLTLLQDLSFDILPCLWPFEDNSIETYECGEEVALPCHYRADLIKAAKHGWACVLAQV
jgi:hypothetical protein